MRRSTLLWSILGIAVVIGLFVVKHRVQSLEDRLHALNAEIIADRDATQVLQAEWSYLNQPARLETLSRRLLGMEPPEADQTVTLDELLRKALPEAEPGTVIADRKSTPARAPVVAPVSTTVSAAPVPPAKSRALPPGKPDTDDWLAPILAKLKKSQ